MATKLIQPGNAKLGKHIYMFNLPATREVCGRVCKGCYAIKEQVRFPAVVIARERRREATLQPDFANRIITEISKLRKPPKYFRVHSSGEFTDQMYINNWAKIAKAHPSIVFYAYTKRIKEFDFTTLSALPNFILIDSFHYGRINYGKLDKAPKDAFICPEQKGADIQCGTDCTHCMVKGQADVKGVFFKQH